MHELNLSNLQRRLLLGGVAPKYVSRTIMELEAHFEELKQAACNAGVSEQEAIRESNRKLGEEDVLVREALAKPELKSWSHRYTKSVYVFAPFAFYICAIVAIMGLVFGGLPALLSFELNDSWPSWYNWLSRFVLFFIEYLFTPLLALLVCVMAKQRNIAIIWPIVGLIIIIFLGSGWDTVVRMPTADLRGTIFLHWGYAFMPWRVVQSNWGVTIEQLIRCGTTIGLAMAVLHYYHPFKQTTV